MSRASSMSGVRALVGAEVLVVDKDERVQKGMTQLLSAASLHVTTVDGPEAALEALKKRFFSVIVIDLDTPHPNAGLQTTAEVKRVSPTSMVVMLTPRKSFDDCVASIRAGAVDIVLKSPESVQYLKERVMEAAGRSVDKREVNQVLAEVKATQDEFLELFVDAEKRALDFEDKVKGRDPNATLSDEIRAMVISPEESLCKALGAQSPDSFRFSWANMGGQALDRASSSSYHFIMVDTALQDLPATMISRSIKTQNPDVIVLEYGGPGKGEPVSVLDATGKRTFLDSFDDVSQLVESLDDLAQGVRKKEKDRRYTQAFRERHYDFLRRYVELKIKIDRALSEE